MSVFWGTWSLVFFIKLCSGSPAHLRTEIEQLKEESEAYISQLRQELKILKQINQRRLEKALEYGNGLPLPSTISRMAQVPDLLYATLSANVDLGILSRIVFDQVEIDEGGSYLPDQGLMRCQDGAFMLFMTHIMKSPTHDFSYGVMVSGRVFAYSWMGPTFGQLPSTTTVLIQCEALEELYVQRQEEGATDIPLILAGSSIAAIMLRT